MIPKTVFIVGGVILGVLVIAGIIAGIIVATHHTPTPPPPPPPTPTCKTNKDCSPNQVCQGGNCVPAPPPPPPPCKSNKDCPYGEICPKGKCVKPPPPPPPPSPGSPCDNKLPCANNENCVKGFCRTKCKWTTDCDNRQRCIDGSCQPELPYNPPPNFPAPPHEDYNISQWVWLTPDQYAPQCANDSRYACTKGWPNGPQDYCSNWNIPSGQCSYKDQSCAPYCNEMAEYMKAGGFACTQACLSQLGNTDEHGSTSLWGPPKHEWMTDQDVQTWCDESGELPVRIPSEFCKLRGKCWDTDKVPIVNSPDNMCKRKCFYTCAPIGAQSYCQSKCMSENWASNPDKAKKFCSERTDYKDRNCDYVQSCARTCANIVAPGFIP